MLVQAKAFPFPPVVQLIDPFEGSASGSISKSSGGDVKASTIELDHVPDDRVAGGQTLDNLKKNLFARTSDSLPELKRTGGSLAGSRGIIPLQRSPVFGNTPLEESVSIPNSA